MVRCYEGYYFIRVFSRGNFIVILWYLNFDGILVYFGYVVFVVKYFFFRVVFLLYFDFVIG